MRFTPLLPGCIMTALVLRALNCVQFKGGVWAALTSQAAVLSYSPFTQGATLTGPAALSATTVAGAVRGPGGPARAAGR